MGVHFLHVSKAGGSALRHAVRASSFNAAGPLQTPWGTVYTHNHRFRFADLGRNDKAVFPLRDPVSRFLSGFYSRLRKGAPRYFIAWTDAEAQAFEWFPTPQALADALAEPQGEGRRRAEFAMNRIRHVKRPMTHWTGKPSHLRRHIDKVLYVARQETLDEDWERLKDLLELPREVMLPDDPVIAHKTEYGAQGDRTISDKGIEALHAWYAEDYEVLAIGEELRSGSVERPSLFERLIPLR